MAKINNGLIFRISIYVIAVVFAAGSVYAVVHYRLGDVEFDVKAFGDMADENKLELVGVKKDIGYLSEKIDRSYDVQKQILTEIKGLQK